MNESRKLAAILAADVVGFSRLTRADEDRTLAVVSRGFQSPSLCSPPCRFQSVSNAQVPICVAESVESPLEVAK